MTITFFLIFIAAPTMFLLFIYLIDKYWSED